MNIINISGTRYMTITLL